jgi:hypothetical protein
MRKTVSENGGSEDTGAIQGVRVTRELDSDDDGRRRLRPRLDDRVSHLLIVSSVIYFFAWLLNLVGIWLGLGKIGE